MHDRAGKYVVVRKNMTCLKCIKWKKKKMRSLLFPRQDRDHKILIVPSMITCIH